MANRFIGWNTTTDGVSQVLVRNVGSPVIQKAISEERHLLLEPEAKRLCKEYDIPVTRFDVASTEDEAAGCAKVVGYPVALKVVSPQVIHKSDAGGVALALNDESQVRESFRRIVESVRRKVPDAKIEGIIVEEMARRGTEVIVGVTKDPQFGPCVMFGLGGIFVELLKDVAFRICPINEYDAREMIGEIRASPVLKGYRDSQPVDSEVIVSILLKVSKIAVENPSIEEMDLNPVIVYPDGAKVVDARVILSTGSQI